MKAEIPDELYARIVKAARRKRMSVEAWLTRSLGHQLALDTARRKTRSGPSRYGFRRAGQGHEPDATEQSAVSVIQQLRGKTPPVSYREICLELDRRGLKPRKGSRWHPEAVRRIHERRNRP